MKRLKNINTLIRAAVLIGSFGLVCIFLFLVTGFQGWSVGIGIFLGFPMLLLGIILYLIAVIADLKKHKVVDD
jgi:multidrug efflux pump subunit AcrB